MTPKDPWTETFRRKEKADEDRYFAEQDRKRIEKCRRQRQPAPATRPHETATDVPAAPAPLASAELEADTAYRVLWWKSRSKAARDENHT